ncbi:TorF family putative porin [Novosphingobium piscinae]|uniref:TorF family putative porin n=1 Tax=Novosphingobium piscinae TaxID=1507448 RepID=UPI001C8B7E46|nr:TorF family putative porin [Novosphingobium piscinae]
MVAALLTGTVGPGRAQDVPTGALSLRGEIALVSDYRFRGVSRSGGDPALQGLVELDHASGLQAGLWASRLAGDPVQGDLQLDLFASYGRELLSGVTFTGGLQYSAFPSAIRGRRGLFEPMVAVATSYGPARLSLGARYAWPQAALGAGDSDSLYLHGTVDLAVPGTPLTLTGRLGRQAGPLPLASAALAAGGVAWDYALGATATLGGRWTLGAALVGSDRPYRSGLTGERLVGTLALGF